MAEHWQRKDELVRDFGCQEPKSRLVDKAEMVSIERIVGAHNLFGMKEPSFRLSFLEEHQNLPCRAHLRGIAVDAIMPRHHVGRCLACPCLPGGGLF